MKHQTATVTIAFAALCVGSFFAPWILPWAEAQRNGYVEKRIVSTGTTTGNSAFADQLAPNPVTGMCLQPDVSNRTVWGPCGTVLPTGTPGQVPQISNTTGTYTYTATGTPTGVRTGTQTTTGTQYTAAYLPPDIRGTYFLRWMEIGEYGDFPMWERWGDMGWNRTGTFPVHELTTSCTPGTQYLLGTFERDVVMLWFGKDDGKVVIPAGDWAIKLRAKVNANSATIRVMGFDHYTVAGTPMSDLVLDLTTDAFSNTEYALIEKRTSLPEMHRQGVTVDGYYTGPGNDGYLDFMVFALCNSSTTVSMELNDAALSSRIETPITFDELQISDILNLSTYLGNLSTASSGLDTRVTALEGTHSEPVTSGLPGQVVGFVSTSTGTTTSKGALDREPTIPGGTPGQLVRYNGTDTGTTTSKGAWTPYSTFAPAAVGSTNTSAGTTTALSRRDHLHACSVATNSANGCMSAADKGNLDTLWGSAFLVKAYTGATPQLLDYALDSSDDSIVVEDMATDKVSLKLAHDCKLLANWNLGASDLTSTAGNWADVYSDTLTFVAGSMVMTGGISFSSVYDNTVEVQVLYDGSAVSGSLRKTRVFGVAATTYYGSLQTSATTTTTAASKAVKLQFQGVGKNAYINNNSDSANHDANVLIWNCY